MARARRSQQKAEEASPHSLARQVEEWPLERLKAYERNARTHPKEQVEQLRASLRKFGWTVPMLVREDGTIIAGHGRLAAAIAEGFKSAPVIVSRGWTEEQCRAYTLADNRLALSSGWDDGLLSLELGDLAALGTDLGLLGFNDKEIDRLLPSTDPKSGSETPAYESAFQVLIECKDEAEQISILTRLMNEGVKCRALIA